MVRQSEAVSRKPGFLQEISEDFNLCTPPVVRVFLERRSGGKSMLKVAMSHLDPDAVEMDCAINYFYLRATLDLEESAPTSFFLSGKEFGEALSENKSGTLEVKASKSTFFLDGKNIPILSTGEDGLDPEGISLLFSLRISRTVAKRLNSVMEFVPDDEWITLTPLTGGIEVMSQSSDLAMIATVLSKSGIRNEEEEGVPSISFPKLYWRRVSSLLDAPEVEGYYIQLSSDNYLVIGALTRSSRFVGLLPLGSLAKVHDELQLNLDWYGNPEAQQISLSFDKEKSDFVKAVNSAPGDSVDLLPEATGLKVAGTDYVLPVPFSGAGFNEKITVPKAYLVGALMTSTLNVTALILGIHLPLTLQLVKGTVSVLLAFKTLFSPVEEKPLQEVAKKAKKKKAPVSTGDVTITPLPEETVAIAQVIAENAGADDQKLLGMIEEVQKRIPAPTKGEQVLEGPLEEVYLGLKVLGQHLTLSFDLKGLKFQAFLSAPSEKSES